MTKAAKKYAFLGVGNMAGAIIRAMIGGGCEPENITLYDKNPEQYDRLALPCPTAETAADAAAAADYIFLAVKPQNFSELLGSLAQSGIPLAGRCFVSIAAGISTSYITSRLGGDNIAVIRTMPNTPLMIGKGVTALCRNESVSDRAFGDICRAFSLTGEIIVLPEDKMNEIIAATSSSPAYVFKFIEAVEASARAQGIESDDLTAIISRMVIGAASMVLETGKTPAELRRMVTSPHGTTEAAIKIFDEHDFDGIVDEAMKACTARAYELGN